jgi:hypothetical protein
MKVRVKGGIRRWAAAEFLGVVPTEFRTKRTSDSNLWVIVNRSRRSISAVVVAHRARGHRL